MNESRGNMGDESLSNRLTYRVEQLEKKVSELEQQIIWMTKMRSAITADIQDVSPRQQAPLQNNKVQELYHSTDRLKKSTNKITDWEHLIARIWLPRIFILVLILGVVWGFTAAVHANIINKPVRCMLGLLAAGLIYRWGELQIRYKRQDLGMVLFGGSLAVAILSLFAARTLYNLIPVWTALVLYIVAIGVGIWTALKHQSQALTIIMMFSGYLVPFLINTDYPNFWSFAAYETIFSIAMILVAHRRSYTITFFNAVFMLHLSLLLGCILDGSHYHHRYMLLVSILIQHVLLFVLAWLQSEEDSEKQPIALYFSFCLTAGWTYVLFDFDYYNPFTYNVVMASLAIIYSTTAYWFYKNNKIATKHMAIATLGWFLWLIHVLDEGYTSFAMLAEGTIAVLLGITFRSKMQQATGCLVFLTGSCSVLLQPIYRIISYETFGWVILIVCIGILYDYLKRLPVGVADTYKSNKNSMLWVNSVLFLVFITQITLVATESLFWDMRHLILSAVWLIYAVAIIVTGVVSSKQKIRFAGIVFLFGTLVKVIFIDLPDVSSAVRAILFIGLGSIGVGISRLFYSQKDKIR